MVPEALGVAVRLRVLLLEDSVDDAVLIERELRRAGYGLTLLRVDSAAALRQALTQPWDVIISDYNMPQFDAPAALALLRASGHDIPFIIVSGTIGEDTAVETMRAGASDYLLKGNLKRLAPAIARELQEAAHRAERRRAQHALLQSEARFRGLIERLPDMVLVHARGAFVYANGLVVSTLGYQRPDELAGHPIGKVVGPDDAPGASERVAAADRGELVPLVEERWMRQDGGILIVQVTSQSMRFDDQPAVVMVARDITEQKRMQAQLLVSERMASVGMLAAGVAHEINNPLAALLGNIDFVHRAVETHNRARVSPDLEELEEPLRDSLEAADRMKNIVRDLMIFSRSDDASHRASVDVRQVLESSLRMAANEIRRRAVLVTQFGEVPPVIANEARLGQVFLNLIMNAAQAMPEGRPDRNEIRVVTRTTADGRVAVEVRDTGHGIPPERLERLFMPFFTTKPIGVGTGLGLSICHRLIAAVGGEIRVESEVARGTTFQVLLPAGEPLHRA